MLAAVGTTFALPRWLEIGPRWLLPLVMLVLLVPTVFAHRTGRHSLNHILGTVISSWPCSKSFISLTIVVLLISRAVGVL